METNSRFTLSLRLIISFIAAIVLSTPNVFSAEQSRHIKIERLSAPRKSLPEIEQDAILRKLIVDNIDTLQYIETYNPRILAHSELPTTMVNFGYKSLFEGMFEAYADHRPFTISPDVIWLLISQGFSNHVLANSEALRDRFVSFDGYKDLVITTDRMPSDVDWSGFVGDFSEMINESTKGDICSLLECDFTTTTPAERVASQATILNSIKSYFRYTVIRIMCGIPSVELYGTEEDWQEIIRRVKELSKYDMEWWSGEMIPVLEEIARSAAGDVDRKFWREMFKYHTKEVYGNPKYVDGWIVKFYPYLKGGKRSDLKEVNLGSIPDEVVRVPIKFVDEVEGKSYDLELCAGFFGLEQNHKTKILTPKIGWYLYEVESFDKIEMPKHYDKLELDLNIFDHIPQSLYRIESIDLLTLRSRSFYLEQTEETTVEKVTDGVVIIGYGSQRRAELPQQLADIKIKKIVIIGTIRDNAFKPLSSKEIHKWFSEHMPNCEVEVRQGDLLL